jgi:hypothetical protein
MIKDTALCERIAELLVKRGEHVCICNSAQLMERGEHVQHITRKEHVCIRSCALLIKRGEHVCIRTRSTNHAGLCPVLSCSSVADTGAPISGQEISNVCTPPTLKLSGASLICL